MAFKSLTSVILTNIMREQARATSSNMRFGSSAASNLGSTRLTKQDKQNNTNEFVWGTNQGVWGKNQITFDYKP